MKLSEYVEGITQFLKENGDVAEDDLTRVCIIN